MIMGKQKNQVRIVKIQVKMGIEGWVVKVIGLHIKKSILLREDHLKSVRHKQNE